MRAELSNVMTQEENNNGSLVNPLYFCVIVHFSALETFPRHKTSIMRLAAVYLSPYPSHAHHFDNK